MSHNETKRHGFSFPHTEKKKKIQPPNLKLTLSYSLFKVKYFK